MARMTPLLHNDCLELPAVDSDRPAAIPVGTRCWYEWLENNRAFRFESTAGKFTARKEQRPGGWYWYAYRRIQGTLRISYLGRSQELTLDQLHAAARQLAIRANGSEESRRAAPQAGEVLLLTRLTIPQTRANFLPRPRLMERLELASSYKLILFSAPAGCGKTTLLSAWSEQRPELVAWLTLDESDNDPISFWNYIIAAISSSSSQTIPPQLPALLRAVQPATITPVLILLSNALSSSMCDLFLVLDDYHLIQSEEIHRELAFFLESLPSRIHLILAGRADPPLPLSGLRAAGQLLEIRGEDLRFDPDEARAFLCKQPALQLSDETMDLLGQRTEGWIAGLQLAALSLQGRAQPDNFVRVFGGQDRYILDYLIEEVLLRQPEHVQRFLLHTSLLHNLSGPLCDAVSQSTNSQKLLEMLESANLFVVALDHQRVWYRYHQLFAEALRHRLQQDEPQLVPQLHLRSANWYASQGMSNDAIEHALAAGEATFAANIIEDIAENALMRGETATVMSWLDALPAEMICARPMLSCIFAFALLIQSRFEAVEERLQDAERALVGGSTEELTPAELLRVQAMLNVARSTVAINFGHTGQAVRQAQEALARLSPQDQVLRAVVLHNLGDAYELQGQPTQAAEAFNRALVIHRQAGSIFLTLTTISSIGSVQSMEGRLHQAAATYRQAIEQGSAFLVQGSGTTLLPPVGKALVSLSELLYEWNDLAAAEQTAHAGINLCRQWMHLWHTVQGYLSLARILLAQGKTEQAHRALDQAQDTLDQAGATSQQYEQMLLNNRLAWLAERIGAQRASLWIVQGNLSRAQEQIEEQAGRSTADEPFSFSTLAQLELLLALNRPTQALQKSAQLLQDAQSMGWQPRQIDLLTYRALTFAQLGRNRDALESLTQALKLAEPEQYVRVFLDKGAAIVPLLQQARAHAITPSYTRTLLAAFPGAPASALSTSKESLNERESEVLRLLADGLANQAIADRLVIALGTVKWYVHAIYSKLGVHSRTQALAEARKRHLLP